MRRNAILWLIVLLVLVTPHPRAFTCTCANESNDRKRERADIVFVGQVLMASRTHYRFRVEQVMKGEVTEQLDVRTVADSCGVTFEQGDTVLVAATITGGGLYTDHCSGDEIVMRAEARGVPSLTENERRFDTSIWVLRYVALGSLVVVVLLVLVIAAGRLTRRGAT